MNMVILEPVIDGNRCISPILWDFHEISRIRFSQSERCPEAPPVAELFGFELRSIDVQCFARNGQRSNPHLGFQHHRDWNGWCRNLEHDFRQLDLQRYDAHHLVQHNSEFRHHRLRRQWGDDHPRFQRLRSPATSLFATVNASHPYTITGNTLNLAATSTITTNANATISSILGGASTALIKAGTGTLTVTSSSTYTGATIVNAGTLVISGGINTINLNSSSSMTINNGGTVSIIGDNSLWGYGAQVAPKVTTINTGGTLTINVAQNTAHLGPVVLAGGTITSTGTPGNSGQTYGSYNFDYGVTAGGAAAGGATSVISANTAVPSEVGGTVFNVMSGATNGIDLSVTGSLANTTGMPDTGIIKTGDGVMQMGGTNSYVGSTTIQGGTLALNYATNNTNKLSNSAALVLAGGTITMTGGSTTEAVGSTTISSGSNQITRVSGSAILDLKAITHTAGSTINFSASSIANTTTANTNGILGPWATINGTAYAINSLSALGLTNRSQRSRPITRPSPASAPARR